MEQAHQFLEIRGQQNAITHIVLESRGRREDANLVQDFRRISDGDNRIGTNTSGFALVFADKKSNSVGMQIADLTAYSIGRVYVAPDKPNRVWEMLVKPKMLNDLHIIAMNR